MRAALVLVSVYVIAGCQSVGPQASRAETVAKLPSSDYVALPRLAEDLHLGYHGVGDGFIELSAPPDNVMLVADSRRALVNGRTVSMEQPCLRRGEQYVLSTADARRVSVTLASMRSSRVEPEPLPDPLVTPHRAPLLPAHLRPAAAPRPWRYIVIHHMAAAEGSAAAIHRIHLRRGYDGLGYHFVIGNGTQTADGLVQVGYRWTRQIHGAHARVREGDDNRWNRFGIGICLVGDFRHTEPSDAQIDSLVALVQRLQAAYGIRSEDVVPHDSIKATLCPGPQFPWEEFHSFLR